MTVPILPGTIGLTPISGRVGKGIEVLQYLNGEGFARWEHAFVLLPGGNILEAEPGGARITPLAYKDVFWLTHLRTFLPPLDEAVLTATAEGLKDIPYSALDYGALFFHRLHLDVPGLRGYIASTGHMICSQMCDEFYQRLGAELFDDKRWAGYVTPASLFNLEMKLEAEW